MAKLATAFGRELDADALRLRALGVVDLTREEMERACAMAVRRDRFLPSVAELRAYAGRRELSAEEQRRRDSLEAVGDLRRWALESEADVQRDGFGEASGWRVAGADCDAPEKVVAAADAVGGPARLFYALRHPREWQHFARDFREAYDLLAEGQQ